MFPLYSTWKKNKVEKSLFRIENSVFLHGSWVRIKKASAWLTFSKPVLTSEARTALPEFSSDFLENCSFVLKYAPSDGGNLEDLDSYDTYGDLSSAEVALDEGFYNFTLVATSDGTVFKGSINEFEIVSGQNEMEFTLSWDKTALDGTGALEFTLDYSAASSARAVALVTGELLSWSVAEQKEIEIDAFTETELTPIDNIVTYSIPELAAGNYRVKIHLYADIEKKHPINTWRELTIITGGQTSYASRTSTALNKVYTITYVTNDDDESYQVELPSIFTRNTETFSIPSLKRAG